MCSTFHQNVFVLFALPSWFQLKFGSIFYIFVPIISLRVIRKWQDLRLFTRHVSVFNWSALKIFFRGNTLRWKARDKSPSKVLRLSWKNLFIVTAISLLRHTLHCFEDIRKHYSAEATDDITINKPPCFDPNDKSKSFLKPSPRDERKKKQSKKTLEKTYPSLYVHESCGKRIQDILNSIVFAFPSFVTHSPTANFGENLKWLSCFSRSLMNGFFAAQSESFLRVLSFYLQRQANETVQSFPSHSTSTKEDLNNQNVDVKLPLVWLWRWVYGDFYGRGSRRFLWCIKLLAMLHCVYPLLSQTFH